MSWFAVQMTTLNTIPPPTLPKSDTVSATPNPTTTVAPSVSLREFKFPVQGGREVLASTRADGVGTGRRTVIFTPFLERTDGNLYNAALHCLWELYGKRRGLFQLADVRQRPEPSLGGNAACWAVINPTGEFCVFPTKDEASGKIAALAVWIR